MKAAPRSLVNRYARSLFDVAVQRKVVDQVRTDLANLADVLKQNREFAAVLLNPGVTSQRMMALTDAICKSLQAQELTRQFLQLLIEKKRIEVLPSMSLLFDEYYREHKGEVMVTVTTAVSVNEAMQTRIMDHLAQRSGKTPLVTWRTNPALLGGLVLEWPDRVFDGSLARKISNLQAAMAGNV